MRWDVDEVLCWTFIGALVLAVVVGVGFGVTAVVRTVAVDGAADFCWIEYEAPLYRVTAHRPWRADLTVARTVTFEEGLRVAAGAQCKVGHP